MSVNAAVLKTINLTSSGTLASLLTSAEKSSVTNLIVTGVIDARDVKCMRDELNSLAVIDMSGANIVAYTGTGGTSTDTSYPANEMPVNSFYKSSGGITEGTASNSVTSYPANEMRVNSFYISSGGKFEEYYPKLIQCKMPNSIKSIGDFAFCNLPGLTSSLQIPNSVVSIGKGAFAYCKNIVGSLIIPNSVVTIGDGAFYECKGLTGCLTLGSSVASIGQMAFDNCNFNIVKCLNPTPPLLTASIFNNSPVIVQVKAEAVGNYSATNFWNSYVIVSEKQVTVNNPTAGGLATTLTSSGFGPLSTITHLTITGNINSSDISEIRTNMILLTDLDISGATLENNEIPRSAFYNKKRLCSVKLPNNTSTISYSAFDGCSAISDLFPLPTSLNTIAEYAFNACNSLTGDLTIPNSVTSIGDRAFAYCSSLMGTISIPNSITSIRNGTFYCCRGLSGNLTIPNSITNIGGEAFGFCSGLSGNLTIPNSVTHIGGLAFNNCSGFSGLTIGSSINSICDRTFSGCSGFSGDLIIPNSVTAIFCGAFSDCKKLTRLYPSRNLTHFSDSCAFSMCTGLTKVSMPRLTPPHVSSNPFYGVNYDLCNLEVPVNTSLSYRTANGWSLFKIVNEVQFDTKTSEIENSLIKVYSKNTKIIVEGTSKGETITLYTVDGKQLQKIKSEGERIVLAVSRDTVYLVRTDSKTFKVIL